MGTVECGEQWARLTNELWVGVQAWRAQHPRATLYEIEAEVEARMGAARSRLLEAAALAGPVGELGEAEERPTCPECGATM